MSLLSRACTLQSVWLNWDEDLSIVEDWGAALVRIVLRCLYVWALVCVADGVSPGSVYSRFSRLGFLSSFWASKPSHAARAWPNIGPKIHKMFKNFKRKRSLKPWPCPMDNFFYLFKDKKVIRFFDNFFIRARIITKLSDNFGKLSELG